MRKPAPDVSPAPDAVNHFWRDRHLPHVELRQTRHSCACYVPHSHPGYSIGSVDVGHSLFTGALGGPRTIGPGTLVYVPPNQVHACNPASVASWSYHMMHLDVAWLDSLREEQASVSGTPLPRRLDEVMLVTAPERYEAFRQLADLLRSNAPFAAKDAMLVEFVMDSDMQSQSDETLPPMGNRAPTTALRKVIDALLDDNAAPPLLAELASIADMGRYQLIREFKQCTGMTPHAYQLNHRINLARDWLRQGHAIANVAYRLGFADQSHFQRTFKARAAIAPGKYRNGGTSPGPKHPGDPGCPPPEPAPDGKHG